MPPLPNFSARRDPFQGKVDQAKGVVSALSVECLFLPSPLTPHSTNGSVHSMEGSMPQGVEHGTDGSGVDLHQSQLHLAAALLDAAARGAQVSSRTKQL